MPDKPKVRARARAEVEKHPDVVTVDDQLAEALAVIAGIASGEIGGRYIGTRLAAACRIRDEHLGKPLQRVPEEIDTADRPINFTFAPVDAVTFDDVE